MRNRKRRMECFSFYDHTGIERHLTEMARKGWMIEKMGNQSWTYRRIEPRELHFTVTYFPKANDFAPAPSEKQQEFYELCAQTGWEFVCDWFQMQVFYNTAEEPVPVDTDPVFQVETIHRACKAGFLWGYTLLFVVGAIGSYFLYSGLVGHTLHFLSRPTSMFVYPCTFLLLLLCGVDLAAYFSWHHKAVKLAKDGVFLDTPSTAEFQKLVAVLGLGSLLCFWAVNLFSGQSLLMALLSCLMFIAVFLTMRLTEVVKQALKRKNIEAGQNRFLTAGAAFLISAALMGCVIALGVLFSGFTSMEEAVDMEAPPLRVEELTETPYENYITLYSQDTSLLLHRLEVEQRPHFEDTASPDVPTMKYELYQVNLPALYDHFARQMKRLALLAAGKGAELTAVDAALFGANEAYRLAAGDGTLSNRYIVFYPNQLVDMEFSWPLTEEQMILAGEKLKP